VSLIPKSFVFEWIIDSGATHHVTSCKNILHDLKGFEGSNTVQLPTGKKAGIMNTGAQLF